MTKDEILQALRLTAMGRAGHPLQEQLAEKLAEVFAPKPSVITAPAGFDLPSAEEIAATPPGGIIPLKRTRKAKAE